MNGVPMASDGRLLAKDSAAPGDQLVLTKALGTGTRFAAHMLLRADGRDIQGALEMMLQSNAEAGRLAVDPVDPESVLEVVEEEKVSLTTILTTHHHWY